MNIVQLNHDFALNWIGAMALITNLCHYRTFYHQSVSVHFEVKSDICCQTKHQIAVGVQLVIIVEHLAAVRSNMSLWRWYRRKKMSACNRQVVRIMIQNKRWCGSVPADVYIASDLNKVFVSSLWWVWNSAQGFTTFIIYFFQALKNKACRVVDAVFDK